MKKTVIIFCALFFLLAKSTFAISPVDLSVTCNGSSCNMTPSGAALFNETNLAPGQTVTKKISVSNTSLYDDCSLVLTVKNLQDEGHLTGVMSTAINSGATNFFSDILAQLFFVKTVDLGVVPKSGSKSFDWIVTFNPAADNSYQSLASKFDFDLSFACGVPPSSPPGTTTTTTTTSQSSPPTCDDIIPDVPTNFSAVLGANAGEVNLFWTAPPAPYTYFLIAYSDNSSWPPKWGNPDVGNVTSYTVSGLGSGTYWFWVRAGNGCKPGSYAGPVSPGLISGIAGAGIASGFTPGVLGEQENLNTGVSTVAAEIKEVKGETTAICTKCIWWPLLIIQTLLIALRRKKLAWVIIVSAFTFLVFLFLNRNCQITGICKYFWLLDLGVLLLFLFLRKMRRDENS